MSVWLVVVWVIGGMVHQGSARAEEQTQPEQQIGDYQLYMPIIARRPAGYPGRPSLTISQPARGDVRFSWTPVSNAQSYMLWLSQAANMAGAQPIYTGIQTQHSHSLAPGTYFIRIQAINRWGAEASAVQSVVVQAPTPTPTPTPICTAIPGASYGTLSISSPPSDRPAAAHPDLNLSIRNYVLVNELPDLVDYNGPADSNAPQLYSLFQDHRTPFFSATYRVYDWDWARNQRGGLIGPWPVTLLGMGTSLGEIIQLPDSGYHIGSGYDALVLYATETRLTLKYTREDNVVQGYTVHLENVCAEPRLLALYNQMNAQGRGNLPALRGGQPLGRAIASEIRIAIRDAGSFMDPRSRKDWWRGR